MQSPCFVVPASTPHEELEAAVAANGGDPRAPTAAIEIYRVFRAEQCIA